MASMMLIGLSKSRSIVIAGGAEVMSIAFSKQCQHCHTLRLCCGVGGATEVYRSSSMLETGEI